MSPEATDSQKDLCTNSLSTISDPTIPFKARENYPSRASPSTKPTPSHLSKDEFCAYHQQFGHTTNSCFNLKHRVQDLIEADQLCFKLQLNSSNTVEVQRSSLPVHILFHQGKVNGTKLIHLGHQPATPIISQELQIPSTSSVLMFNPKASDHKLNAPSGEDFEEIIYTPLVSRVPRHPNWIDL